MNLTVYSNKILKIKEVRSLDARVLLSGTGQFDPSEENGKTVGLFSQSENTRQSKNETIRNFETMFPADINWF